MLWSRKMRLHVLGVFSIALVVNVGMWLERFVIVVTSLTRDFVPSSWGMYYPTIWDWSTYVGTIGVFLTPDVPVHSRPARDFDFRDARSGARHGDWQHAHGD